MKPPLSQITAQWCIHLSVFAFVYSFKTLHRQDATNQDIFQSSVDDLVDFYLAGFNVCLFVMGESESGKTYTLAGEGTSKGGIVPMVFDALFGRLQGGNKDTDVGV